MRKNQKEIQERMNNIIIKKENKILSIGDNVMMITCQDSFFCWLLLRSVRMYNIFRMKEPGC